MADNHIVHLGDDSVRIGPVRGCAAGCASLAIPGGVLLIDPLDPAAPSLELSDPAAAQDAVVALFGLHAWDVVRARVPGTAQVRGWALTDASRLALIRWLSEYSPDALDDDLLDAEAAVLTDRLSTFLPAPSIPTRVRERALTTLDAALRGGPQGPPELWGLSRDVVLILADRGDSQAQDLASRLTGTEGRSGGRKTAMDWRLRSVLTPLAAGLALDDAVARTEPLWRQCSTDWDLVPRGAFAADEDCIRWRITGVDGPAPLVQVEARAGWDGVGSFIARLLSPSTHVPLALAPLQREDDRWTGSAPVGPPTGDVDDYWVDITSADAPRPARRGTARIAARGRRWAARGVTRLRWGLTEGALLDSPAPMAEAIGSIERARLSFADLGSRTGGAAERRWHYELGLTLRGALGRRGEHYEVDDLEQDLAAEAVVLAEAEPPATAGEAASVPRVDLTHPAWDLTVAERGLLVPDQ